MIQVYDKYGKIKSSGLPGFGTVTSFSAGNLSPLFNSVVTSPTSTPNIAFSAVSQAQKLFYASPNSGSGLPSFRTIQASDLPSLSGTYVPISRTLTINGVTFDLSTDRTWTISSLPSQTGNIGKFLTTDGTNASWATIPLPTPAALTKTDDTNVTLTLGGSPSTALLAATSLTLGWTGTLADSRIASATTWNAKQDLISLTTTGTGGVSTLIGSNLNIPQYMSASTRRNANDSTNNNINYCGVALGTGVSESSTVWTITRLTIGASGSITIATATNVAWTNRESATYI